MLNENYFIELDNNIYNNKDVTNSEVVVYALIQKNYIKAKEIAFTSINTIMDCMYIRNNNAKFTDAIREAIEGLLDKGYIKDLLDIHGNKIALEDIKKSDLFYCVIESLTEQYFQVSENNLDIIFKHLSTTNIDKFAFARYYIAIMRVIHSDQHFGWLTQKSVKSLVGENKTVSKYNKILADELKLIIYNNNYVTKELKYTSTFFGNVDDPKLFEEMLQAKVKRKELIYSDKKTSNKKRSTTQKIKVVEKKIESGDGDEKLLAEIERLKKENEKLKNPPSTTKTQVKDVAEMSNEEIVDVLFNDTVDTFSSSKCRIDSDKRNIKQHNIRLDKYFTNVTGEIESVIDNLVDQYTERRI